MVANHRPKKFSTIFTPFCIPQPTARNTPRFCGAIFRASHSQRTENYLLNLLPLANDWPTFIYSRRQNSIHLPAILRAQETRNSRGQRRKAFAMIQMSAACISTKLQYFGPIPPEIYEYRIGGYQVCDKWLKDRKDRHLELDDIRNYCRMVTAIGSTLEIQQELDIVYADVEQNLVTIPTE